MPNTQPNWSEPRPCMTCKHFGHWVAGRAHVWCLHGQIVQADPDDGCAYWKCGVLLPANAEPPNEKDPPSP